jgi:hypothetical protein
VQTRRPRRRWTPWFGLSTALLLLLLSVLLVVGGGPQRPPASTVGGAFVPVVPLAGAEPAWTVLTDMPRERLAQLGLPYDPGRAGERVRAELLLDRRGEVLAVRPLTLVQRLD